MIARWITTAPDTRVLKAVLDWRATWSPSVLLALLILAWLIAIYTYRTRRIDLPKGWRIALGSLRLAVLAVPVVVLMQPHIAADLEKTVPKALAVVVDESLSMSVRDGAERASASRWQTAVRAADAIREGIQAKFSSEPTATPQLEAYLFSDQVRRVEWSSLSDAGTSPTGRRTVIADALRHASAGLAGRPAAGVLLLSDGADNAHQAGHEPAAAAREVARNNIPIHAALVGNEHPRDASVSVVAETPFAFAGDPVSLRVRINHQGYDNQMVSVSLSEEDRPLQTRDVLLPGTGESALTRFDYQPDKSGRKRCRVELAALPGELTISNNSAVAEIQVIDQPLRVLYLEHWPRWQYQFLRNAMQRDHRLQARLVLLTEDPSAPPEERQASSFPTTEEELKTFDTFIIGDVAPQDLSPQQWENLRDRVIEDGAGIIFVAGPRYMPSVFLETAIAPLLPFERASAAPEDDVEPYKPVPTALGLNHPIMRVGLGDDAAALWQRLPNLQWLVETSELKPGAVVLAERTASAGGQPLPLIMAQRSGRGSCLFVATDETWRWRYEVGNRFFYGFWAQAIQHVGMQHRTGEFKSVHIQTSARAMAPETPVHVTVSIDATAVIGALPEQLTLLAERTEGAAAPQAFRMQQAVDAPWVYEGRLQLGSEGTYRLYVEGMEDRGDAGVEVSSATAADPELADPSVNPDLLKQLASLTGGRFAAVGQLPELIDQLDLAPLRYRWSERIPLWDGWTLLALLTVLLTIEWVLRKWLYLP